MADDRLFSGRLREDFEAHGPPLESCGALFYPGGDGRYGGGPSESVDVVFEELRNCGQIGGKIWRFGTCGIWGARQFIVDYGSRDGVAGAAMAGVTGHLAAIFEIVFVESKHHLHHAVSGALRLLVIFFEVALDVTKITLHPER